MSQRPIQTWLTDTKLLQNLLNRAHYLAKLSRLVQAQLSSDLASHCQVANYELGRLKLVVDSSVWASRLRFSLPHLNQNLKRIGVFKDLQTIHYSVQPLAVKHGLSTKRLTLSKSSSGLIADAAVTIGDDKLRQALLRLANREE